MCSSAPELPRRDRSQPPGSVRTTDMLGLLFPFLLALPTLAGPARSAPLPAAPAVVQKPVQKPAATPRTVGRAPQQTPARKPATAAGKTATRGPKASLLTPAPPQGSGAVVQSMVTLGGPVTSIGGTVGWWGNNTFMTATPITAPTLTQRFPTPDDVGLWHLRLVNTPSGWVERFLLVVPENDPATDIPLLVAFHRFGNSMWDIVINTQLPREANARGWYLLAPMGASDISFSSMESQMNTELVLGLVCELGQQAVDVVCHPRDCIRLRDRVARSTPRSRPGGLLDRVAPRGYHRRA